MALQNFYAKLDNIVKAKLQLTHKKEALNKKGNVLFQQINCLSKEENELRLLIAHPLFSNLIDILPRTIVALCKELFGYEICPQCNNIFSIFSKCVFHQDIKSEFQGKIGTKDLLLSVQFDEIGNLFSSNYILLHIWESILFQFETKGYFPGSFTHHWMIDSVYEEYVYHTLSIHSKVAEDGLKSYFLSFALGDKVVLRCSFKSSFKNGRLQKKRKILNFENQK